MSGMAIPQEISTYIDVVIERTVDRAEKRFDRRVKHYMAIQRDEWRDDLRKVIEMVTDNTRRIVALERFVR